MDKQQTLALLNHPDVETRLANLARLLAEEAAPPTPRPQFANNHIHTFYSFSPYSPAAAVWFAREAGLQTAGIMDHDSIAGGLEFRRAGKLAGIGVTCGMELRVSFQGTGLETRKLNNPDQAGIAYMAVHSIPPERHGAFQQAIEPYRQARNRRNRQMVDNINRLYGHLGIQVDFDRDVLPISHWAEGGSITERHLMWAVAQQLLALSQGQDLAVFLEERVNIPVSPKQRAQLAEKGPYLSYDLLGILKSHMIAPIYVPATDECMSLSQLVGLCKKYDALLCYPYLGDVGESVTGDKKAEQFEDSYLDSLFQVLEQAGVGYITYMPSRNTDQQIQRLRALCLRHGMGEISGEDVNSPSQSFICQKLAEPGFSHLVDAAWALVRREARD